MEAIVEIVKIAQKDPDQSTERERFHKEKEPPANVDPG